ncbi:MULTISPECIES: biotin--[acetyl-CoA-carboxylase] ligase [unclassified Afipia]|uniref:biotin--[acetyl-CoA-carboxylase] ligase n=1 Tax=unclassified Afipia TaxID=2642050 RepID=UPI000414F4EB|nr:MULTISPECIES: biotin--[acetyl-CoA-carboxylase] ligase [unclassified Afipia]
MAFALGPRARAQNYRVEAFDSIGSTNAEALERARAGERGPLWLVTDLQTAGRGRRQREWVSPRGNLAATILESVDVQPPVAATLGFAAGLALEAALQTMSMEYRMRSGASVQFLLKWPNDVLANGKKLSGILLEAETFGRDLCVAVGMGTNVISAPEGTPYPATSLAALGITAGAGDLFMALSDAWAEFRGIWDNGRGFGEIRSRWLDRAAGLGEAVSIQSSGTSVEGIFETIDETGCLIIAGHDGKRTPIAAGDVHFGSAKSSGAA